MGGGRHGCSWNQSARVSKKIIWRHQSHILRRHALKVGDAPLSTREALRYLGAALGTSPGRFAAFRVADWSKSPWRNLAATEHLVRMSPDPSESIGSSSREEDSDEVDQVALFLRKRVSEWLPEETLDGKRQNPVFHCQLCAQLLVSIRWISHKCALKRRTSPGASLSRWRSLQLPIVSLEYRLFPED